MCCDIRCAEVSVGQPEIKLSLIPGGAGTQRRPDWSGSAGQS